jgi:hypothetical protein
MSPIRSLTLKNSHRRLAGALINVWFFSSVVTLITKQQWQNLIGLFNQYGGQM